MPQPLKRSIATAFAVDQPLQGSHHGVEECPLALKHAGDESSERLGDKEQDAEVENNLSDADESHSNFSGFSNATNR
jgi:hypothetical protein